MKLNIVFFTPADNEPADIQTPALPKIRRTNGLCYTEPEKHYLRDNWQIMTTAEIAQALGRTKTSVASMASKLELVKNREALRSALSKEWQKRETIWTESEMQYLRDNWQTMSCSQIGQVLGRSAGSVKNKGRREMGLRKTAEAIRMISARPNAGQFKKGNLPANTIYGDEPVIRIRHNHKRNIDTKYIRIGFAKWQEYQHYVWEAAHGPVPKGMILTFINGDRMDCRLDNLKLITMAENAIRNSGSLNLADGYVAHTLAWHDPDMQQEVLKHPDLIELKRKQLQLNRTIKQHGKVTGDPA